MSRTSPAALELQRSVVRERSGGRISVELEGIHDFKVWDLPCEEALLKLQRASGFDQSSPKLLRCGRAVWDRFASALEVAMLRSYAVKAFEGLHHRGAEVSLVLPFHRTCGSMGDSLPKDGSLDFAFSLAERIQSALSVALAPPPLHLHGALLRRVQLPAVSGPQQLMPSHDSFAAHADRATVAAYHYSAVLYLSERGDDFQDGELVFMDSDGHDRCLEPRAGRLVGFSSGLENLHRVVPPVGGPRYILALWFGSGNATCMPELTLGSLGQSSPAESSRVPGGQGLDLWAMSLAVVFIL